MIEIINNEEGAVIIWNSATGEEETRLAQDGEVNSIAFSPDGRYVVSGSQDGTILIWIWQLEDLFADACSRLPPPRNLNPNKWEQYIGDALPYQEVCPNLPIEPEPTATP